MEIGKFFTFAMKINTYCFIKHQKKVTTINKLFLLKYLIKQFSLFTIYIISASPLEAQENINFTGVKEPIRELNSLSEEPLQWSMQRTITSATTTKIVWSAPIFSNNDTDNSVNYHSLKWKFLPYSEIEVNSNILLDIPPSIDVEALIPASSIHK